MKTKARLDVESVCLKQWSQQIRKMSKLSCRLDNG
jgi:hypothetical protein